MPSANDLVVVIGTGGTIAGTAARPQDHVGYKAATLSAADLLSAVPALAEQALESESLAQLDSCDMDHATWVRLALSVKRHLARPEVAGVVVTHGTDTLEETAFFLHHTIAATKPVVMTAAMRPATAPSPDGPQNLVDAVALARHPGAQGVLAVLGGTVFGGAELRKLHGYRVDAFGGGDAGPLALVQDGALRALRPWPAAAPAYADALEVDCQLWPAVDIVTSHAGARATTLHALVAAGAQGLVLAGTGNGSVHQELLQAARRAQANGVAVLRASRCVAGGVIGGKPDALPSAGDITPAQARVLLLLQLLKGSP
jgi:L-asparaginase